VKVAVFSSFYSFSFYFKKNENFVKINKNFRMEENKRLKYIGVKNLGNLALPDFCPRCFWYERHFGPFPTRFPGIFNVLDAVSKKSVNRSLLERGKLPDWLRIPDVVRRVDLEEMGKVEIMHNRKYLVAQPKDTGWILRGDPDIVFELKDKTLHIVDFKTARFTERQSELFPLYEVQLNGYALLSYKKPVSQLSLVYCQPNSELPDDLRFRLEFTVKVIDINFNRERIFELLRKAREIVELKEPPPKRPDCKNTCFYVDRIINHFV
jgi:CRISPR/Cas system-associated exonuclease Cas4 (RecB family)